MNSIQHLSKYIDSISGVVKKLRFAALVIGAGLTALAQYGRTLDEENLLSVYSGWIFVAGITTLLLTNFLLVVVDKQSIETLKSLHKEEERSKSLELELKDSEDSRKVAVAWVTLNKLISELLDQAIKADEVDEDGEKVLYETVVEFVAAYKSRLFGIEDDYVNIAIYEFLKETEELVCVACYRSRPSDAKGPHRSWRKGEGHVGKAFELQNELVCGDATVPDMAAWIAAPPKKFQEADVAKYVSLAAIPLAIDQEKPLGVVIMTSSERYRFVNFNEAEELFTGDVDLQRAKFAVAALQDIAAQVAQLMSIMQSKRPIKEGGGNGE